MDKRDCDKSPLIQDQNELASFDKLCIPTVRYLILEN